MKQNNIARSIVANLLIRQRSARKLWLDAKKRRIYADLPAEDWRVLMDYLNGIYLEAANAAESSRRILYGNEL